MTLDTTIPVNPPYILQYGIPVTVFVADQALRTEVWRAPDNAGVPNDGAAVLATTLLPAPQGGVTFIDALPNDGAIRYYKSRHVDEVGNVSSFTAYTEGLTPILISGAGAPNPMAAFGAIVDQLPPNSKYEIRFAPNYTDPDFIDGMQSYIDFPASTNFLRLGTPPQALVSSTNATPINVQVTNHGYATGDRVIIRGHLTNTNANGPWTITVVDAHNFTLNGSTGNGVGIGTGRVTRLTLTVSGVTGALTMYGDLTVGALTVGYGSQLLSVVDTQASPVTRTKLGKVGVATTDYGIQVFDQNAATIMDFTGAKRILAVPVQASVDSGSACTLDLSTGLTQQVRVTAASWTLVLNNPTNGGRYRLWMQQDSVAGRPWPSKITDGAGNEIVMYTNDTPPVLSSDAVTAGEMALYEFEYRVSPTKRFTCMTLQKNVLLPTPQVQSVTPTAITASATNHNVSMPATVNLGDLLITIVVTNNQGISLPPTGWTRITSTGRSTTVVAVDAKVANGTEGGTTVNWTTDFSCVMAAHVYRITKWYGSLSGVAGVTDLGTSTTPDPPAATPGWAVDRDLWIATAGIATAPSVTSTPANYTNRTDTAALALCTLTSARRSFYASTENPGTFTISASNVWCAMTIAIRPPS